MRILHIYKTYDPVLGGIENHIKMLAEAEAARGDDVSVLVTSSTPRSERTTIRGVRVIRAARALEFASTPFSLAMAIEASTLRPDVVNLHMPYPPGDIVARGVGGRPALVVSYHSDVVRQQQLLRIYRPVLEATLGAAHRVIAGTHAYLASSPFLSRHTRKSRVVPYAVDAARFATFDAQTIDRLRRLYPGPVILSVGVLRYYKGLHILLAAMREVAAQLVIVGDGPERARLETLAREMGVAERVHFAGRVPDDDLPSYYQAADIFVLASHLRAEAFGIVLLEAMAAGLPLVTTELGTGTSEVNQHGTTGFVVPPDDPEALARALRALLADRQLREHLGQNGRRRAQAEYTPERMVQRTGVVYHEALEARRTNNRRPATGSE